MADPVEKAQEPVDILNMSDDQMASMSFEDFTAMGEETPVEEEGDPEPADGGEELDLAPGDGYEEEDDDADPEGTVEGEPGDADDDLGDTVELGDDDDSKDGDPDSDDGEPDGDDVDKEAWTTERAELFAPLQAAGREVKVESTADARQLMQMGVDYNRKMQAMKPGRKVLKLLDNHGLMDEAELSYLIDLKNKRPEAIAKLVQESGIDPLDIKVKSDAEYTPNTYAVGDAEVELDSAIEDLRDSPHYDKTADIISNKWDEASQHAMANNPKAIKDFNAQVGNGMYEQISGVMEVERMMGRLDGLNDIQAYQKVGNQLFEMGKLKGTEPAGQQPASAPKAEIKAPAERAPAVDKSAKRKRAASPKGKPAKQAPKEYNPLSMSDEDFAAAAHKYL